MKLMVDARYTRIGFHDGISRYTASLLGALKTLIDTGDEAAADLDLTMIISDERQLEMLPDLPHCEDLLAHRPARTDRSPAAE